MLEVIKVELKGKKEKREANDEGLKVNFKKKPASIERVGGKKKIFLTKSET